MTTIISALKKQCLQEDGNWQAGLRTQAWLPAVHFLPLPQCLDSQIWYLASVLVTQLGEAKPDPILL